ncbi:MAG: retropepsin-like domain-containing protein, partial [Armatimonadota bacterium]|nr:retropepsin-like domain-containing protein [Armatimonadota bacterium]
MKHRSFCGPLSAFVLLVALSLPGLARPQASGETLRSLLAKHQRAMNVPGARPDKTAHKMVYALSAASLAGTLTIYESLPGKTREEINLGPLHMVTASDGRTSWEQDMTGAIRIVRGEELAENKADESFSIDSYDPFKQGKKAPKGRVTLRPQRDPATGCFVLDILPQGGSQQTVFLDPKTYLVRKFIERKGGLAGTISILSYQTRFGARVPSHLQIGYAGLPMTIEATLSQATGHVKLASNFFAPPQVARDFEFLGAQAPRKAVVPFRNDDNEIVVPVVINGQTLHFIVDSGAASSFITGKAAQKAGLTAQG